MFSFSLAEKLGIADPRVLYQDTDVELLALWAAHFALREERQRNDGEAVQSRWFEESDDQDVQTSACERILMM